MMTRLACSLAVIAFCLNIQTSDYRGMSAHVARTYAPQNLYAVADTVVTEDVTEPAAEPAVEPATEPTAEPAVEPAAEPAVEPAVEPATEPTEQPAVEPAVEPVTEPTEQPAVEPAVEPATEPTEQPAVEPAVEPATEPTEQPAVEPAAEPSSEPAVEPASEPTEEPAAEPAVDPVVPPAVVTAAEETIEQKEQNSREERRRLRQEEREQERAASEAAKELKRRNAELNKQIEDSVRNARREEAAARKEANRLAQEADAEAARLSKLQADSLKAAKKEQARHEKERNDSIRRARKEMKLNLTKHQLDSLRMRSDSLFMLDLYHRSMLRGMDTAYNRLIFAERDSIRREAKKAGLSMGLLDKWSRYFSTIYGHSRNALGKDLRDIVIQMDTVRRDSKAGKLSLKKMDEKERAIYGRKVMVELRNKKAERLNENSVRAIETYVRLREDISARNKIATYFDSLNLVQNRKPGEQIWKKLQKRSEQREKRIWKDIEHNMRTYNLADYDPDKNMYGGVDLKQLFALDSCFAHESDRMSAKNTWRRFSIRTNTVYWLLGMANLGIEFDLSAKPTTSWSLLLHGAYKPNMNSYANKLTRINFAISKLDVEIRKYWRVGGMQTVDRPWDPRDYSADSGRPDTLRPRPAELYGFYNGLHRDTTMNSEYRSNKLPRDTDSVVIWTSNWLKRTWQPFRYNKLSGRFMNRPKVRRVYYLGAMVGYDRYHYVLNSSGKQGKEAYICATGGIVFQDLAKFKNGTSLDLDIGLALGMQGTTFQEFDCDTDAGRYRYTSHKTWYVTPYPVIKDIHVSLVYSLRPMRNKVHNLFQTEKFRKKLLEIEAANAIEKDKKEVAFVNRQHLRNRARWDVKREHNEYLKRKEDRANKKKLEQELNEQRKRNGGLTDEELAKKEYEEKVARGEIVPETKTETEWDLREKAQPEKEQYGTIEYFDPTTDL